MDSGKSRWRTRARNTKKQKGEGCITIAIVLLVLVYMNVRDPEPMAHLFGMTELIGLIAFVVCYMWHEIARVYPQELVRRKRIHAVLSGLSGLLLAPLTAVFITLQFYLYIRERVRSEDRAFLQVVKNDSTQWYFVSIIIVVAATWIFSARMLAASLGTG